MDKKLKIYASKAPWSFGVDFLIRMGSGVVEPSNIVITRKNDTCVIEPSFHMESNEVQELMDQLWQCGYRPSEGTGSAGSLRATEKHLSDMRDIVFNKININRGSK